MGIAYFVCTFSSSTKNWNDDQLQSLKCPCPLLTHNLVMWGAVCDSSWPFAVCFCLEWSAEWRGIPCAPSPPPTSPFFLTPGRWKASSFAEPSISSPLCLSQGERSDRWQERGHSQRCQKAENRGPQTGWDFRGLFVFCLSKLILPKPCRKQNISFLGGKHALDTWKVFVTPPFCPLESSAFSHVGSSLIFCLHTQSRSNSSPEHEGLSICLHSHCHP